MIKIARSLMVLLLFAAMSTFADQPNVIMIVTDEEMVIPPEWRELLEPWYEKNMPAHNYFRRHGLEFKHHHGAQFACTPARYTIYTGQYGRLTQTDGFAKSEHDPQMTWLDEYSVPTIGNYLEAAGFDIGNIGYLGKFHLNNRDIHNQDGKPLPTVAPSGKAIVDHEAKYREQHPLRPFGFANAWIGPEPHGANPINSGNMRDPNFIDQAIAFIETKSEQYLAGKHEPFFLTLNLVNPHDIVLAIGLWMHGKLSIDDSVPMLTAAPETIAGMFEEALVHHVYRDVYKQMYSAHDKVEEFYNSEEGRMRLVRFYYTLLKRVNAEIMRFIEAINSAPFFDNTYVIYTSDHGDLLGRSDRYQKWHSLESRITHVPFYVAHPSLSNLNADERKIYANTSHADIVPTVLGLFNIEEEAIARLLKNQFSDVHHLVGKDLSPIIRLEHEADAERIVYSISQDNISDGESRISKLTGFKPDQDLFPGVLFPPTAFPVITGRNHVEAIRFFVDAHQWAFHRYYNPLNQNDEEFFLYDASTDPLEINNLAHDNADRLELFKNLLEEQRQIHLLPSSW